MQLKNYIANIQKNNIVVSKEIKTGKTLNIINANFVILTCATDKHNRHVRS